MEEFLSQLKFLQEYFDLEMNYSTNGWEVKVMHWEGLEDEEPYFDVEMDELDDAIERAYIIALELIDGKHLQKRNIKAVMEQMDAIDETFDEPDDSGEFDEEEV